MSYYKEFFLDDDATNTDWPGDESKDAPGADQTATQPSETAVEGARAFTS